MKRLISIFILLFLVSGSFAKTADFLDVRVEVVSKASTPLYHYITEAGYNAVMKSKVLNP